MPKNVPTVAEIIESTTAEAAARSLVSPFAHLAGAAAKAEDDEEARAETDDDPEKEKDKDKDKNNSKARKAKTKAEEDDDDKKDDDKKEKDARRAERARIHAILTCPGAASNLDYATYLAFETDIPAAEAIGHVTHSIPKDYVPSKKDSLRDRMAGGHIPDVGAGDTAKPDLSSSTAMAAAIIAAGKKRRGEIA